jgi:hypothetical protein
MPQHRVGLGGKSCALERCKESRVFLEAVSPGFHSGVCSRCLCFRRQGQGEKYTYKVERSENYHAKN